MAAAIVARRRLALLGVPYGGCRHPGLDGGLGERPRGRAADHEQQPQSGRRGGLPGRAVQRQRVLAELEHLAEHRDLPATRAARGRRRRARAASADGLEL